MAAASTVAGVLLTPSSLLLLAIGMVDAVLAPNNKDDARLLAIFFLAASFLLALRPLTLLLKRLSSSPLLFALPPLPLFAFATSLAGKNSLSLCARLPPPDSPPPVNATQRSSLGIYYALTLHAFNRLTAAALTPLPPAAHLPHCAHVYVRISNCSRKAKRADVIRPSADEVCSRNSTEIAIEKY